ncbi:hypothetical protein PHMEG_00022469 [Phytophthora megakarya]|uniref:PiggyBac transposable element-derived protein domain-containing protein n=1 Tax=Phytophthora megakarya TaxID=4795 RepID=A0A225VK14_9STRA|nr:hypothetical protein PHMEG_00022469 [Phytophthora megakarya]
MDENEEEELRELVCPSDEGEDDAKEELSGSEFVQTATNKKIMKEMRHSGWEYNPVKFPEDSTPLALLFFFLPLQLCRQIQKETNTYHFGKRTAATRKMQRKADPDNVEPPKDIRLRLRSVAPVTSYEILLVFVSNNMEQFLLERSDTGFHGIGVFHVMQNLNFTNSKSTQASVDRGWKVRSVVTTLQETFARGYDHDLVIAFDETINPTRQYLPPKRHKWGPSALLRVVEIRRIA